MTCAAPGKVIKQLLAVFKPQRKYQSSVSLSFRQRVILVVDERMADRAHVHPNLVGPPCQDAAVHERVVAVLVRKLLQDFVVRTGRVLPKPAPAAPATQLLILIRRSKSLLVRLDDC